MYDFSKTPLYEIEHILQALLQEKKDVSFIVPNPDNFPSVYNGNTIETSQGEMIHRGYKTWVDLAHQLRCRMLTPHCQDDVCVVVRYEKLSEDSFHSLDASVEEKYGENSIFSTIHKNEESGFLHYYTQALHNVHVDKRVRILNLGVNQGDEFELIENLSKNFENLELVGIDYCQSAIEMAQKRFQHRKNVTFYTADITKLADLDLGMFDLVITIGTLQSTNLSFQKVLMDIVQNRLKRDGAMILGFPNCRWIDGEMIYGAMMKNYSFSEMSNLYKDVNFAKKYLQQKKFRVTITGKDYIFVTATSIL